MHVILTGATGLVGGAALHHCLASPKVTHGQLSILSRRQFTLPSGDNFDTKKAKIIVHTDYESYPDDVTKLLKGAESCIWAQGISQTEVKKDQYIRITYDYPLAAAKAFSSLSETGKFNFIYISGEGADPTERTFTLFGKIKGRAEAALLALPSTPGFGALRVFNVRPGFVDPSGTTLHRPRSIGMGILERTVVPLARALMPSQVSPTGVLSKVLVDLATGDGDPLPEGVGIEAGGRTIRSSAVRILGRL
ncbi:hypothetical protein JAAARDRAFT_30081 [Jaapia argillacea MUCL 33604]|uniref:NAD(P)-binding domain-containing protein n=1 Tax=Jaapia argillacea MUCL 33604 TaxID=933084 RepID=A0A067Q7L7_9AGAM|nr:hypothetical protein JAAARDRAFT_30081 [Jaapia argillacea MUCL 33604]